MAKGMYSITRRDIDSAYKAVRRERDRSERDKLSRQNLTNKLIRTGTVMGGALGSAMFQGYTGITGIGPVPVDLAAGAGLIALSYLAKGMTSDILGGLGEGALASFATKYGASIGSSLRSSRDNPGAPATSGVGAWAYGAPAMSYAVPAAMPYGVPAYDMGGWAGTDAQVVDMFQRGIG